MELESEGAPPCRAYGACDNERKETVWKGPISKFINPVEECAPAIKVQLPGSDGLAHFRRQKSG